MLIQFECRADKVVEALDSIRPFAAGKPQLLEARPLPASPVAAAELEARAQDIAKWIKPREIDSVAAETIRFVLTGSDTFFDLQCDPDPALRNATGALSKKLRRFARFSDSPLEILCERRREVFPSGPSKGLYRGTRYYPTKLGARVYEILKEWKAI